MRLEKLKSFLFTRKKLQSIALVFIIFTSFVYIDINNVDYGTDGCQKHPIIDSKMSNSNDSTEKVITKFSEIKILNNKKNMGLGLHLCPYNLNLTPFNLKNKKVCCTDP